MTYPSLTHWDPCLDWGGILLGLDAWVQVLWPLRRPANCGWYHSARHRCLEDLPELCHGTSIFRPADQNSGILFLELSLSSYVLRIGKHTTTILYLDVLVWALYELLSILTIRSAMPFEDAWWAGEYERVMFFSKHRSRTVWLVNSPPPSAWFRTILAWDLMEITIVTHGQCFLESCHCAYRILLWHGNEDR